MSVIEPQLAHLIGPKVNVDSEPVQTRFHYFFDWDPGKAASNFRKHKVTFETAATVFGDPLALSVYDEESSEEEERWVTLGRTEKGRLLVVVHTYR